MDIKKLITDQFEEMVAFRRDLHEHAESSGNEVRTAARISEELTKSGIEHIVTPYHDAILNYTLRACTQNSYVIRINRYGTARTKFTFTENKVLTKNDSHDITKRNQNISNV